MPLPTLSVTWSPTPAMVRSGVRGVGKNLARFYMDDLESSGWPKDVKDTIVARTRQGRGREGPMPPLSPAYAIIKGSSVRDLTVTGDMLNQMIMARVSGKNEFLIFIIGEHAPSGLSADLLALFHELGTKLGIPAGKWFGLSSAEEAAAIGVSALIFEKATLPRLIALLERL